MVGTPAGRRRGAVKARGSDFGPLRSKASPASRGNRRMPDVAIALSPLPREVMETLEVLVEIELARRARLSHASSPVERETRSPAQAEVTGTIRR